MRTYTTEHTVYTFNKLSGEAKQHALEQLWDLNVYYDWWGYMYEDAENIGLKITGFDLDRGAYVCGGTLKN